MKNFNLRNVATIAVAAAAVFIVWKISRIFRKRKRAKDETKKQTFILAKDTYKYREAHRNGIRNLLRLYKNQYNIVPSKSYEQFKEIAEAMFVDFQKWFISNANFLKFVNSITNEADLLMFDKAFGIQTTEDGRTANFFGFIMDALKRRSLQEARAIFEARGINFRRYEKNRRSELVRQMKRLKLPVPQWIR